VIVPITCTPFFGARLNFATKPAAGLVIGTRDGANSLHRVPEQIGRRARQTPAAVDDQYRADGSELSSLNPPMAARLLKARSTRPSMERASFCAYDRSFCGTAFRLRYRVEGESSKFRNSVGYITAMNALQCNRWSAGMRWSAGLRWARARSNIPPNIGKGR
jgi:hypothetical protein